jgi:hypothetical protein
MYKTSNLMVRNTAKTGYRDKENGHVNKLHALYAFAIGWFNKETDLGHVACNLQH